MIKLFRRVSWLTFVFVCCVSTGCYLTPPSTDHPQDPFQGFNRDTNRFNTKIDRAVVRPIAQFYVKITPYFAREGVSHFFDNLDEPSIVFNDAIQGNFRWALNDSWRFVFNSTVGLLGFIDVAKSFNLQPHDNDFGLTLNHFGIYTAYLVLPFMGPKTVGGALAMPMDYYLGITQYFIPVHESLVLSMVSGLNVRASLLTSEQAAGSLIFDEYLFYRSAYTQTRAYLFKINEQGPEYDADRPKKNILDEHNEPGSDVY